VSPSGNKTELIERRKTWRSADEVELAAAGWAEVGAEPCSTSATRSLDWDHRVGSERTTGPFNDVRPIA
jgi:hypothetical protein